MEKTSEPHKLLDSFKESLSKYTAEREVIRRCVSTGVHVATEEHAKEAHMLVALTQCLAMINSNHDIPDGDKYHCLLGVLELYIEKRSEYSKTSLAAKHVELAYVESAIHQISNNPLH